MTNRKRTTVVALFCLLGVFASKAFAVEWVPINGHVLDGSTPLCSMVLANGQHMFSCSQDASYDLMVPLNGDGLITLQVFTAGFSPFRQLLTAGEAVGYTVEMVRDETGHGFSITHDMTPAARSGWSQISGTIDSNGTPVCAMVLANGQNMFSCGENLGQFALEAPEDSNKNVTLQIFAFGFMPYRTTLSLGYSITHVDNDGITEYRFMFYEHHFMTLVNDAGTLNLRPHPGVDINGWGSSWYAQPFLPGAVLKHTNIAPPTADTEGIHVNASGNVSNGESSTYGTWGTEMDFNYIEGEKRITGAGEYSISLDGLLSDTTGDLNLYKIASNYLDDVPLLSGGVGDTGDMTQANITGDDGLVLDWIPPNQPAYFPSDTSDYFVVDVLGQYNEVDTQAQGYNPIDPAYKPSLKVGLTSQQASLDMIFGGIYDWDKRQGFWEDNVGITLLVLEQSTQTEFLFDVEFESTALPEDGQ